MAMTYSSLVASKGTAGSVASWVNYSKLDIPTIVDEAQSLIYSALRVREMRSEWVFGMSVGQCETALPARFLDPIGRLYDITNTTYYRHRLETEIQSHRPYTQVYGSLPANPFTTTAGLTTVSVHQPAHGLTQASTFTCLGATTVDVFNLNATWPVVSITDANNFVIDTVDTVAVTSATGGGSAATYTANALISGSPNMISFWNEMLQFDLAFDQATQFKQLYYRAPALLSTSNPSNWLVNRYPRLMRSACLLAAADFMKDDNEYSKNLTSFNTLLTTIAAENDMIYRGSEFGTDTP